MSGGKHTQGIWSVDPKRSLIAARGQITKLKKRLASKENAG